MKIPTETFKEVVGRDAVEDMVKDMKLSRISSNWPKIPLRIQPLVVVAGVVHIQQTEPWHKVDKAGLGL